MTSQPIVEALVVHLADPDEVLHVVADSRDRRSFERAGRLELGVRPHVDTDERGQPRVLWPSSKDVILMAPEEYRAWLAWAALTRTGKAPGAWARFRGRVLGVYNDEQATPEPDPLADPTPPDRSAG